jgi:hypothetical protein
MRILRSQRTSRFYLFICSLHYITTIAPTHRTTPHYTILSITRAARRRRRRKIDSIAAPRTHPHRLPNRKPTAYLYAAYIVSYRITYNYRIQLNTTVLYGQELERGNKSKGMARKFAAEPRSDRLVLSTCATRSTQSTNAMAATAASPAPAG